VVGDHREPPGVPRRAGECGADEDLGEADGLVDGLLASTEAEHVGVIVQPRQLRRLGAPGQGGADAANLVRRDLLAVAGTADNDPEAAGVGDGGAGRAHDVRRIVVLVIELVRPAVHRFMTGTGQPFHETGLQREASMVGS
jgi:hypothetical protein